MENQREEVNFMNTQNFQYLLFDLDGTLTDSAPGILGCVKYALTELSLPLPPENVLFEFIGPPLVDAFSKYCGLDEETAKLAVEKYRERYSTIGLFENRVYDGVPEMLSSLSNAGKTLILATSKPKIFADRILEKFDLKKYFYETVGATFDGRIDYKDEVIEEALKRCEIKDKSKALMIGDRHHDIDAAKKLGLRSLGVLYGFSKPGELENCGADLLAATPEEVVKLLLPEC